MRPANILPFPHSPYGFCHSFVRHWFLAERELKVSRVNSLCCNTFLWDGINIHKISSSTIHTDRGESLETSGACAESKGKKTLERNSVTKKKSPSVIHSIAAAFLKCLFLFILEWRWKMSNTGVIFVCFICHYGRLRGRDWGQTMVSETTRRNNV